MVVESKQSGMADVPTKSNLPRKSAFSCEACRKRKVGSFVPLTFVTRMTSEINMSNHHLRFAGCADWTG